MTPLIAILTLSYLALLLTAYACVFIAAKADARWKEIVRKGGQP